MNLISENARMGSISNRGTEGAVAAPSRRWLTLPMGLCLLAWLSINSGPGNFTDLGSSPAGTMNAIRAAFPLVVLAIGVFGIAGRSGRQRSWVEKGFWVYGVVALLACTGAPRWFDQAYWGFAFLGFLTTMELAQRNPDRLAALERLNVLSWLMTTAALVAMLFLARDSLMAPEANNSAYGFLNRFQKVHGYAISRETGLSRMAAVPAIISLVFLLSGRFWQRLLSLSVFLASIYIIWIMQSRGALFAFAGALLFGLLFGHKRGRGTAILLFVAFLTTTLLIFASQDSLSDLWLHATRDTGSQGFVTQSGRLDIWADLLREWMKSPLFGYGPQADRLFNWNAQNAIIYALICGGLIGAGGFIAAMVSAWRALIRLAPRASRLPTRERKIFQITGALFVFYTLRSIPENNAALFSVDLLLQYPSMLYLISLERSSRNINL